MATVATRVRADQTYRTAIKGRALNKAWQRIADELDVNAHALDVLVTRRIDKVANLNAEAIRTAVNADYQLLRARWLPAALGEDHETALAAATYMAGLLRDYGRAMGLQSPGSPQGMGTSQGGVQYDMSRLTADELAMFGALADKATVTPLMTLQDGVVITQPAT